MSIHIDPNLLKQIDPPSRNTGNGRAVTDYAKAAAQIGIATFGLVQASLMVLAWPFETFWPALVSYWYNVGIFALVSLSAAVIVTSLFTLSWTRKAITRRWKLEDEDREARKPVHEIIEDHIRVDAASGELLELYGWRALAYQFLSTNRDDLTREYANRVLHIPERAYNKLNAIFVEMNIKTDKAWNSYTDAATGITDLTPLAKYDRVSFDPDGGGAWVDRKHIFFKEKE